MTQQPPTRSKLALKGSSKVVSEFFEYSINSILFQRGIYPPEDFHVVKKYGLNMLVTIDVEVKSYIRKIMNQINKWMGNGKISKLIVTITCIETGDIVERWQFDIELLLLSSTGEEGEGEREKQIDEIQREIQAIIRQITASVTFLPVLQGNYTFNVLVYADGDAKVPTEWIDSDAKDVCNAQHVKLRSFTTNSHKVDTMVAYKLASD